MERAPLGKSLKRSSPAPVVPGLGAPPPPPATPGGRAVDAPEQAPLPSFFEVQRARLVALVLSLTAAGASGQEAAPSPAGGAGEEPQGLPAAPGAPDEERVVGPTPGAPTISLSAAVDRALEQNFALLDSADSVSATVWQERAARGRFYPQIVPVIQQGEGRTVFGLDVQQRLPWSGGVLTGVGRYVSEPEADAPFPRTTDLRLVLSQPLLRGFGPNATYFDLTNARRARTGQERSFELSRQRVAIQVAAGFYNVIAQRQLLDVAAQSLERTEGLQRASEARLEVGMASKLDVFRAELQAAQARDAMVRAEAGLEGALEQFRGLLALPPADPLEPEATELPRPAPSDVPPVELLVQSALAERLELIETRDRVGDAERAYSLSRQNLLPQLDVNVGLTQLGYGGSFGDAWAAGRRPTARWPRSRSGRASGRCASARSTSSRTSARPPASPTGFARASSCSSGRWTWRFSSGGWRCCATSGASGATSTWSTPRRAWWSPAPPS